MLVVVTWMVAFVEPVLCGHLLGNQARNPSFVQANAGSKGVDSRGRRSHIFGITLAGASITLEKAKLVGVTSEENN